MLDYMVMEAVAMKVRREDERVRQEMETARKREEFKKNRKHLTR